MVYFYSVRRSLDKIIKEHSSISLFVTVLFLIGIIFGAILVNNLGIMQKQDLFTYLSKFFSEINSGNADLLKGNFLYSFKENLQTFFWIWILGISIVGFPLILLILFVRGIIIGFTVGFLVNQAGWKGFFLACSTVLPHNLIIIPLLLFLTVCSMMISIKMVRRLFTRQNEHQVKQYFMFYVLIFFAGIIFLFFATIIEVYFSPLLMNFLVR